MSCHGAARDADTGWGIQGLRAAPPERRRGARNERKAIESSGNSASPMVPSWRQTPWPAENARPGTGHAAAVFREIGTAQDPAARHVPIDLLRREIGNVGNGHRFVAGRNTGIFDVFESFHHCIPRYGFHVTLSTDPPDSLLRSCFERPHESRAPIEQKLIKFPDQIKGFAAVQQTVIAGAVFRQQCPPTEPFGR